MNLFITGFLLSMSLCLDLGIVNVYIIKTGIDRGFQKSLHIGLGSTIGDVIYALLSMIGITLLLKYLIVRWMLWIGGTFVLLYFCIKMIMNIVSPVILNSGESTINNQNGSDTNYFLKGFLLAMASPTAILWFASIGGSVIAAHRLIRHADTLLFLSGFFAASIAWSFFLAYISFKGGQIMKDKIKQLFSILSALLFLILAVYIFINGYRTMIN